MHAYDSLHFSSCTRTSVNITSSEPILYRKDPKRLRWSVRVLALCNVNAIAKSAYIHLSKTLLDVDKGSLDESKSC
ncbi:unnamed protein product [Peronospora belbahrii]|uniref:Uncharacterized protein n=1 Tax=Peronospora belbahrii TaxID=622444 RepID=A0AAU9KPM6_9STRA|nr:unnamed protein product [Peronospora belbahrii]